MLVRHPRKLAAGTVCNAFVQHHDITATALEASGVEPAQPIDGKSFLQTAFAGAPAHARSRDDRLGRRDDGDRRHVVVQLQDQRQGRVPARHAATRRRTHPNVAEQHPDVVQRPVRARQGRRRRIVPAVSAASRPRPPAMRRAAVHSPRSASAACASRTIRWMWKGRRGTRAKTLQSRRAMARHKSIRHRRNPKRGGKPMSNRSTKLPRPGRRRVIQQAAALGAGALAGPWIVRRADAQTAADVAPYHAGEDQLAAGRRRADHRRRDPRELLRQPDRASRRSSRR